MPPKKTGKSPVGTRQAVLNYRALSLVQGKKDGASTIDEENRSVEVIAATENPVEVFDYERWEVVNEILLMDGCQLPENRQVPLIDTHDRYSGTVAVLGSCRELAVADGRLLGRSFFSSVPEAESPWTKVREGHLTDFSIGYRVLESFWIPENEKQVIAGRTFEGPVKVSTKWMPRELSICPIGADAQAKARSAAPSTTPMEEKTMDEKLRKLLEARGLSPEASEEDAWAFAERELAKKPKTEPTEPPAADPAAVTAEELRAQVEAERTRAAEIMAIGERYGCLEKIKPLIGEGKSVDEARKIALDEQKRQLDEGGQVGHRLERGADERDKFRAAAEDAISIRTGMPNDQPAAAEDAISIRTGMPNPNGQPAAGADELTGYTLVELARMSLSKANQPTRGHALEMVGRALTTSDFSNVLANVAHKALFTGFEAAEETWQKWCAAGSVANFLTHSSVRASETDDLDEVTEEAEYKHGKRTDGKEEYQIATYGKLYAISRQAIINDDLGALTDVPRAHGEAASRKIGDIAYAVLTANAAMGDGVALFASGHSNLAGSGGAVAVSTLGAAIAAMKKQKDLRQKRRLNIRPNFFIGPVSLEAWCEQFFGSANLNLTGSTDSEKGQTNPYAGKYFTRIYEPRLDDDSEVAWYLAAAKNKTVKLFFLNGIQKPYLETRQGWNVDGVEYKVRIDAGAKAMDWRGLYKNPGA